MKIGISKLRTIIVAAALIAFAKGVFAATSCQITPSSISVGNGWDNGSNLWVIDGSGVWYMLGPVSDGKVKTVYSTAMLAISLGHQLVLNYSVDQPCDALKTQPGYLNYVRTVAP